MHDTAIVADQPEHVVGDVARVRVERIRIRVGENDRRASGVQRIAHRVGTHVGQIREHSQPVHFADQLPSQAGQTLVFGPVGGRVGPVDVVPVGQRQVPGTEFVEDAQRRRRILDHVAAFDAHQAGDLSRALDALDVVGCTRLLEVGGRVDESQRNIEFAQRLVQRHVRLLRN